MAQTRGGPAGGDHAAAAGSGPGPGPVPDENLAFVARTWEPRLVANGVDPNDYRWTIEACPSWAQWYGAWMGLGRKHETLGHEAEERGQRITAGEAYYRAAIAYHFAVFCWVENMDEYTAGHRKKVECYTKALPALDPPGERVEFPLDGVPIPAYLRKPSGVAGALGLRREPTPRGRHSAPPVVLLLSGLDSVKEEHATFERFFLRRGIATLTPDGPGQGEMWFRMKMRLDFEVTATAAIDYLLTREDVDGAQVGVCGVSLGGYLAPRCAAFEPRLKAVASCGGLHTLENRSFANPLHGVRWRHIWGARDNDDLAAKTKGATLAHCAGQIRAPLLVVHGEKDNLIPPGDAHRTYELASGPKWWVCYPEGNHVCNNIIYKYRPLVADFMAVHLGAS